jgi:hypothetical protein
MDQGVASATPFLFFFFFKKFFIIFLSFYFDLNFFKKIIKYWQVVEGFFDLLLNITEMQRVPFQKSNLRVSNFFGRQKA